MSLPREKSKKLPILYYITWYTWHIQCTIYGKETIKNHPGVDEKLDVANYTFQVYLSWKYIGLKFNERHSTKKVDNAYYLYRISLFVYRKLYNKAHSVKPRGWYFYSYIMVEFWGITYNPTWYIMWNGSLFYEIKPRSIKFFDPFFVVLFTWESFFLFSHHIIFVIFSPPNKRKH